MLDNSCENSMKMSSNYAYRTQDMYAGRCGESYSTYTCNVPVVIPVYIQAQPVPPVYIQTQPVPAVEIMPSECPSMYQY